jgi:hypothetical protein
MQANSTEYDFSATNLGIPGATPDLVHPDSHSETADSTQQSRPVTFRGHYASCMEMYASAEQVARYLDAHRDWFPRCAHPMKADPIGENSYGLLIGRFGSFGYEVEAKIGLDLLPQDQGIYRIQTIPIPGYEPPGYEVDFRAELQLVEAESNVAGLDISARMTQVEWELNLNVTVQFPRFIQALPKPLIQSTGDRLLNQIVRQVSRCLTHKVQDDFHQAEGLAFPRKRRLVPWGKEKSDLKLGPQE